MKRLMAFLLFICFIFAVSGCYLNVRYSFLHDTSEIASIEIVEILEPQNINDTQIEKALITIEDVERFLKEFSKIPCDKIYGQPSSIFGGTIVIKLTYTNGAYELISNDAQHLFYVDRPWQYGSYVFDKEPFEALIKEYLDTSSK